MMSISRTKYTCCVLKLINSYLPKMCGDIDGDKHTIAWLDTEDIPVWQNKREKTSTN